MGLKKMDEKIEKAYSPKEVFTTLDIGDSTLRKWCIALEKNGYVFIRNDQKGRIFVEADLVVLRHFQNLIKQHNMQLDNAATLVIDRFGKGSFEVGTLSVPAEEQSDLSRSNEDFINKLLEHIKSQEEFNRTLLERLDWQQKYIEERLGSHDGIIQNYMKEAMETRRLIAATQEQAEQEKKGFWSRLFGK
jgi:hypothetical protein